MGKSTISMAMFNSFLYVYQMVDLLKNHQNFLGFSSHDPSERFDRSFKSPVAS